MAMKNLVHLVEMEIRFLIFGLALLVFYQMLMGKINLKGIFADASGQFSAARVQMLMATFILAGSYLADPHKISTASTGGAAALMGGSNILYLVNKFRLMNT